MYIYLQLTNVTKRLPTVTNIFLLKSVTLFDDSFSSVTPTTLRVPVVYFEHIQRQTIQCPDWPPLSLSSADKLLVAFQLWWTFG